MKEVRLTIKHVRRTFIFQTAHNRLGNEAQTTSTMRVLIHLCLQ